MQKYDKNRCRNGRKVCPFRNQVDFLFLTHSLNPPAAVPALPIGIYFFDKGTDEERYSDEQKKKFGGGEFIVPSNLEGFWKSARWRNENCCAITLNNCGGYLIFEKGENLCQYG